MSALLCTTTAPCTQCMRASRLCDQVMSAPVRLMTWLELILEASQVPNSGCLLHLATGVMHVANGMSACLHNCALCLYAFGKQ